MHRLRFKFTFATVMLAVATACAPITPPDAGGPRGNVAAYPVLMSADNQRREIAAAAISRLNLSGSTTSTPRLHRATSTIEELVIDPARPLYLPKLGTAAVMTEEETRESLRRFIREWRDLIGADPTKLSLVGRVDQPDGTKTAIYEHRPFRYPIRGPFGRLELRFTTDRRILSIASTCIPDAERIQAALNAVTVRAQPEDVVTKLRANAVTYKNQAGTDATLQIPASSEITPRELVTYIRQSPTNPDALEFHMAWEVDISNAPVRRIYIDAVNGDAIATE